MEKVSNQSMITRNPNIISGLDKIISGLIQIREELEKSSYFWDPSYSEFHQNFEEKKDDDKRK